MKDSLIVLGWLTWWLILTFLFQGEPNVWGTWHDHIVGTCVRGSSK